jgi:hypothetical protein
LNKPLHRAVANTIPLPASPLKGQEKERIANCKRCHPYESVRGSINQ